MKKRGIKFNMKDGTADYYDPLYIRDFSESDTDYILDMTYTYEIDKSEVIDFEWYNICDKCGHEVYSDGCRNCNTD